LVMRDRAACNPSSGASDHHGIQQRIGVIRYEQHRPILGEQLTVGHVDARVIKEHQFAREPSHEIADNIGEPIHTLFIGVCPT